MPDYTLTEEKFYDNSAHSKNIFRSWYHRSRNQLVSSILNKYLKPGMTIADLGCGNAMWNTEKLPVIGVDINEKFLEYSYQLGRISQKVKSPLDHIDLPDHSIDIIIITEVIEHLPDLDKHFEEMSRLLKPGGFIISSVPYDTNLSLFKPLFFCQCFYRGTILGEKYYQECCGHINHFSPASIRKLFAKNRFEMIEQVNHLYFVIFTVFKKMA
jgi:ubiquinone/menaquinone biosynthesis C-methylase UbiE